MKKRIRCSCGNHPVEKTIFTTGEVAAFIKVMPRTVCSWFDSGRLRGWRVPGTGVRKIPKEYLLRFMREHGFPIPAELAEGETTEANTQGLVSP